MPCLVVSSLTAARASLVKGLIVDRVTPWATGQLDINRMVLNIGGDLIHLGRGGAKVAIEDPARPFDNSPPLTQVVLRNAGLATSGSARRDATIAGRWYSHVLDPRSGATAESIASASVIEPDAATADVAATVLSILAPAEGLQWAEDLSGELSPAAPLACCIVERDGGVHTNAAWLALSVQPSTPLRRTRPCQSGRRTMP